MARQFQQLGISGLEDLFAKSEGELQVLRDLEYELRHRQVPRARSLMVKVRAAIKVISVKQVDVAVIPLVESLGKGESDLFGSGHVRRQELNPTGTEESDRGKAADREPGKVPLISVSDAYKALRATSGSSWESIELTRRQLVQVASPVLAADEKRKNLQRDAERVNAAYKVIAQDRIGSR